MMKPKTYEVLKLAVEEGVAYGYKRAFKHIDNPDPATIEAHVTDSVMTSIFEWFDFEGDKEHSQ